MYFPSPPEALFGDQLERGRAGVVANEDFPLLSASLRIAAYMSLPLQHGHVKSKHGHLKATGFPLSACFPHLSIIYKVSELDLLYISGVIVCYPVAVWRGVGATQYGQHTAAYGPSIYLIRSE